MIAQKQNIFQIIRQKKLRNSLSISYDPTSESWTIVSTPMYKHKTPWLHDHGTGHTNRFQSTKLQNQHQWLTKSDKAIQQITAIATRETRWKFCNSQHSPANDFIDKLFHSSHSLHDLALVINDNRSWIPSIASMSSKTCYAY